MDITHKNFNRKQFKVIKVVERFIKAAPHVQTIRLSKEAFRDLVSLSDKPVTQFIYKQKTLLRYEE